MPATGTPILTARDLSKRFGPIWALRNASFSVPAGKIVGLIGPNGAGKTTLFDCVAGVSPATTGDVLLNAVPVRCEHRKESLFYLPDSARPWGMQRVSWALEFAANVFGASTTVDKRIIDALGIHPLFASRLNSLSKGEHKRVMLAVALMARQPLLLLDEPFDGLDLRQALETMSLLRELCIGGRTFFLSIHQLGDAEKVCDRFVLMSGGRTVGEGTLDELRASSGDAASGQSLAEVFLALT